MKLAELPFEFRIVPGSQALDELDRLRSLYPKTGLYPVLMGDQDDCESAIECLDPNRRERRDRRRVRLAVDAVGWFDQSLPAPDCYIDEQPYWPEKPAEELGISAHLQASSWQPKNEVVFVLLPIDEPCEALEHLEIGGWNDCPFPDEHTAVHRYWHRLYGSEVVSARHDFVECLVSRPPRDQDTAHKLARQQYIYCGDFVEQNIGSISILAKQLLNSPYWYFWWD